MINKFIVVLIVWIFLSLLLFQPFEKIPLSEISLETENKIYIDEDTLMKPSPINSIRKIFGIPFDLEWYDLKIIDNSSLLDSKEKSIADVDTYYTIKINGNEINTTEKEKYKLISIRGGKEYFFNVTATRVTINNADLNKISNSNNPGSFYAGSFLSAEPNLNDFIAKIILLLIAIVGFYELFRSFLFNQSK